VKEIDTALENVDYISLQQKVWNILHKYGKLSGTPDDPSSPDSWMADEIIKTVIIGVK
jgi:hypothetical protein